jgi:hypothetical protein
MADEQASVESFEFPEIWLGSIFYLTFQKIRTW